MSTYANVLIVDREFNVRSDGGDKEDIRDCVREYVKEIKGKVKSDYLRTAVLNAITADSVIEECSPFSLGFVVSPNYEWEIKIGERGGVKIVKGG